MSAPPPSGRPGTECPRWRVSANESHRSVIWTGQVASYTVSIKGSGLRGECPEDCLLCRHPQIANALARVPLLGVRGQEWLGFHVKAHSLHLLTCSLLARQRSAPLRRIPHDLYMRMPDAFARVPLRTRVTHQSTDPDRWRALCGRLRVLGGYQASRRCSRDTYPESYITKYASNQCQVCYSRTVPGHQSGIPVPCRGRTVRT